MKINILLFLLIFASWECFSQNKNEVGIYYGFVESELLRTARLDGDASYDNSVGYEYGLKFLKALSGKLSVETGVNYLSTKVDITPAPTGLPVNIRQEELQIISIPVFARLSLGHYFFANGGLIFDIQNTNTSFDSQSGVGMGVGIGGKLRVENFLFYVIPNLKRHSIIPFYKENYHQKLTELGIQIGLGYQF